MFKMRNKLLAVLLCLSTLTMAQTFSPERTGGVYYAYPVKAAQRVDIPEGFEPFYISHYGRHGSRWLPSQDRYEWVMRQFVDMKFLIPLGYSVKSRLDKVYVNAFGNAGKLTKLGKKQQQGIARRMAANYPEVFRGNPVVTARSSTSPRCRASMLAFIKELPCKGVEGQTDPSFMEYLNYESPELKALTALVKRQPDISPERLISSMFIIPWPVEDPVKLMSELHTIASDMQDIPLKVNLWDIFTKEEMMAVHAANNERMTICNGDTLVNDGIPARSSIALWEHIEKEADEMIAAKGHGASLRFGHDTALYRLLTLLRLQLPGKGMEDIIPMAANLQMIFCRNAKSEIVVKFLLNEKVQKLPILSVFSDCYRWEEVKSYMRERIHYLEHLRQLAALHTMVGTAPANTLTAGLFGKGSEEHGQTLPAVLVPHGQTFWTPQTQDTEKKCIAPYYYTDTLFQGIRASHWPVGGCTQDYGSFTVSALSRAWTADGPPSTRFSHASEVSHPHYYAVALPDEQLLMELTALSHSAILRVTPFEDGPVHIMVSANSDEGEGDVTLDEQRRQVYGFNPVHRIYQGWGERAGFSGHFLLQYADRLLFSRKTGQRLELYFDGKKGQPIILRMATSFTSREGAAANLQAEASVNFDEMEHSCIDQWVKRLHTIEVTDPDTARVNQFYGALYRSSFLPREMSDVDGSYPKFADGTVVKGHGRHYGDFSMWDTYRALHPLLNIIAPDESAEMMQSLVDMYDEGGWLPIFPCWNSYTAAMIGDHCSSVLADAYVKGIRTFDANKAYEAMRKNAFEQPSSFEEYKNGMGRRALDSYLKYGFVPLEDSVKEAFHTEEQTSRTLEYAYDDFCVAQMAKALGHTDDYQLLMQRSENWRNVINPTTGYADGRHADGRWAGNDDVVHRKPYITEGATCHYTWYVPQNVKGLMEVMGGQRCFVERLDELFSERRYWHGNEPCHQVAWLYSLAGEPAKCRQQIGHILVTEYNDSPGGLSGNDDAGQMSAWQVFAHLGFYPVCPATTQYVLGGSQFQRITINQPGGKPFVIQRAADGRYRLNGRELSQPLLEHADLVRGGELFIP